MYDDNEWSLDSVPSFKLRVGMHGHMPSRDRNGSKVPHEIPTNRCHRQVHLVPTILRFWNSNGRMIHGQMIPKQDQSSLLINLATRLN